MSHYKQYPPGTEYVYSYFESRGGKFDEVCFFGLQYFIKRYLLGPVVTRQVIDDAKEIIDNHMGPGHFNADGWEHILKEHGGKLPLSIKAVPEGTVVPTKNVLFTMVNTDPKCFWLTNVRRRMRPPLLAPTLPLTGPVARGSTWRRSWWRCGTR